MFIFISGDQLSFLLTFLIERALVDAIVDVAEVKYWDCLLVFRALF